MHQNAIFGAGRIGSVHAANIAAHSKCNLAAIVDPDLDAADRLAGAYGTEVRSADRSRVMSLPRAPVGHHWTKQWATSRDKLS